jgi:hypothetical protein
MNIMPTHWISMDIIPMDLVPIDIAHMNTRSLEWTFMFITPTN